MCFKPCSGEHSYAFVSRSSEYESGWEAANESGPDRCVSETKLFLLENIIKNDKCNKEEKKCTSNRKEGAEDI